MCGAHGHYAGPVTEATILDALEKMARAVEHVQNQFTTVRTGRASPVLVEKLLIDYYGSSIPLQQLAGFSVPEARQLIVKPHDVASLGAIERAIRDSDLGVSPNSDGVVIRINFPALTEERRKEFVKIVKHMAEEGRISLRNIRRDARKHLEAAEKATQISATELERAEKEMDKITHDHVDMVDKALGRKEQELLEV